MSSKLNFLQNVAPNNFLMFSLEEFIEVSKVAFFICTVVSGKILTVDQEMEVNHDNLVLYG